MSFAAPGILFGLLALALPLWLHRLRTDSARSEPFSSVRLLQAATQRVYVDRRIRFWLLLALRLALLTLLVLMFARPRLAADSMVDGGEQQHWILVDLSASMGQRPVQDNLRATVQSALDDIPSDQPVGLLSIDGAIEERVALGQPRGVILNRLSDLRPGNGRLDFGDLLNAVGDYLDRDAGTAVVHLVSDFQSSAMPA
ncbi:MAG: BatA domain-containing protein, partial [Lysobacterales bacterium]